MTAVAVAVVAVLVVAALLVAAGGLGRPVRRRRVVVEQPVERVVERPVERVVERRRMRF